MAEHESDLRQWWRLARHGIEWAEEAALPQDSSFFATVPFSINSMMIMEDNDDEETLTEVLISEELDTNEPSLAVLHFCSSACLDSWASQAAALE